MSTIQDPRKTWLATESLLTVWLRMPVSGAEIAPCLQALAVPRLPLCLQWGKGPVYSHLALLWYLLNPFLCEQARLRLRLEFFMGKFSCSLSFFLSLWLPTQFGLLSHLSSLRLSSGQSGLVLNLCMQPVPLCPDPTRWWRLLKFGLLLCWELRLGTYSVGFLFSSRLCCLLRFQNSSQTCW